MQSNLDRRIEILFPIENEECRKRVFEVLIYQILDTDRARIMQGDGSYIRFRDEILKKDRVDSQVALMKSAIKAAEEVRQKTSHFNRYEPLMSPDK